MRRAGAGPRRCCLAALVLLLTVGWQSEAVAAEIGTVRHVLNYAYRTQPSQARQALFARDPVAVDQLVETVRGGAVHIRFVDESSLRLGSASRVRLDRYLYDPDAADGQMTVTLGDGQFRLITGRMRPEGILLVTPQALVGARGTDFILWVKAAGDLVISVLQGEVSVTPLAGGRQIVLTARGTAAIDGAGRIRLGVPPPPADPGLQGNPQGSDQDGSGSSNGDVGGQRG